MTKEDSLNLNFLKLEDKINQLINEQYEIYKINSQIDPKDLENKVKFVYGNVDSILVKLRNQHRTGFDFFMKCINFLKSK